MVGPHDQKPPVRLADHWYKKGSSVKENAFKNVLWWQTFRDQNLTDLIHCAYQNNLNLHSAGVHVLQARAQLAQAVGQLYPQQQGMVGSLNYYRMGGGYLDSVLPSNFAAALLGFSANWEIDFWGKYRRAIQAKDAMFMASLAAYDAALVTLTADVATQYINIRTSEALIRVTQENIALQQMSLKLTQARYESGEVSLLDVEQAKTELSETQSQLPVLVSQLQSQKDALAVLLGLTPNEVSALVKKSHGIPQAPSVVNVGIPKESLSRRPDIHQARQEAAAELATIGQIKANLYPSLALAGNFSFASNTIHGASLGDLFSTSNVNILAGPTLNWPLLNYGQITNAVRAQDALYQQALLKYVNLILVAQKEVQDSMTRYTEGKKSESFLRQASKSAIRSTQLTLIQYREGEDQYTTVLYAEQQQLRVQTSLVKAQAEVPLALVSLYRALGGGWQLRRGRDLVPLKMKDDMAARTWWGDLLDEKEHRPPVSPADHAKQLFLPQW